MYRNQNLFSDYYLQELLTETPLWREVDEEELQKVFDEMKSVYQRHKLAIPELNESQLEEKFIRPILKRLNHIYEVNVPLPEEYAGVKHPDYAFYASEEKRKTGIKKAIAVGEAKRFGRSLDRKSATEKDPFESQNPSSQISRYLWISEVSWGILTDGKFWRIYERETSKRIAVFYEVDLFKLLEEGTIADFKYFYYFFRKEAFPEFLQKVRNESLEYAQAVGEELKENVYEALKILAKGFLETNNLSSENLEEIQDNCHIFLYRLLFVLHAEYREFLPLNNEVYANCYSLDALKKRIARRLDSNAPLLCKTTLCCRMLEELFRIINNGNDELGVPAYNGGLFDPLKHPFLEKYKVGDYYVAKVIDFLARSSSPKNHQEKVFVDYGSLEIRHLGSIYEGLLEYKLKVAETDMVAVNEKGKEIWKPKSQANERKVTDEVSKGDIYCVTDKGERKATGSYYTPGYIVDYIVENTLAPLCDKITNKIRDEVSKLEIKVKESRGMNCEVYQRDLERLKTSFSNEVFKLKVLDPAMGSGHFLVRATEYLAGEIATNPYTWDEEAPEGDASVDFWKRRVVEKCIYGVDLNPLAVELAKVSLWLATVAKDKPLSFLDHHLHCGNSLIGAEVKDLGRLPKVSKNNKKNKTEKNQLDLFGQALKKRLPVVLSDVVEMLREPSDRAEQVREKENIYNRILDLLNPLKEVADVWTSVYFGNEKINYEYMLTNLENSEEWSKINEENWFKRAKAVAEEKHFFHWELEFPEVFFDKNGNEKSNPGFDIVMGNPPYGIKIEKYEREFINSQFDTNTSNSAAYFLELSQELSHQLYGMIVPKSIAFYTEWKSVRRLILDKDFVSHLLDVEIAFKDANYEELVLIVSKNYQSGLKTSIHHAIPLKKPEKEKEVVEDGKVDFDLMKTANVLIFRGIPSNEEQVINNIRKVSLPFGDIIQEVFRGLYIPDFEKENLAFGKYKFVNRVPDVQRYFIERIWQIDISQRKEWLKRAEKILVPRIFLKVLRGSRLIAFYDRGELLTTEKLVNVTLKPECEYSYAFILTLINSPLISFYLQRVLFSKTTETSRVMDKPYVSTFPIRRISFITPGDKRQELFEKAKELYETYLKTEKWGFILSFVQQRLATEPEESDAVHDILAFLAEKMTEYNKSKGEEIKGFLKWLEREIGTEIENLVNKTAIKEYYESSIEGLFDVLKRNKRKLKINPSRRDFQMELETEFNKSISILAPLARKIESTDKLIDQIIYKLYGLTKEEIEIIEEHSEV